MKYNEKMSWYNLNYRNIYGFSPKSFWEFKKDNTLDILIKDNVADETLKKDLKSKKESITYNQDWGARKSLSKFNSVYAKNIINFFTCKNDYILDPFAGRTRYKIVKYLNRNYIGFELNNEYIEEENLFDGKNGIINDDCLNIDIHLKNDIKFDCLFTCPPYWDLEVYSKKGNDLSNIKKYDDFLIAFKHRINNCLKYIKENGLVIIVVADYRRDNKVITLHYDIRDILKGSEWDIYDTIILEMNPSARDCYYSQAVLNRRMLTTHEYLMVFSKNTDIMDRKFDEDFSLDLKSKFF